MTDRTSVEESLREGGLLRDGPHSLLPEPRFSPVQVPIASVDDHFVEPRNLFLNHMSKRFGDRIPRVIENEDGVELWQFEDVLEPNRTMVVSVVGRPRNEWTLAPVRFDEMRPGSYDPKARLSDMDLAGVSVSMCFPSSIFGFAGQRFFRIRDRELGFAAFRAYNDWVIDEWVATDPRRFIAQQVMWFPDPNVAAEEIRANATRGFRSVAFSENPEALGFPSLYTDHWDPFFRACSETGTVIDLHVGSSSKVSRPSSESGSDVSLALFPVNAMLASVDWVYARVPVRFPDLKIVFSESGISWVPTIQERLRRNVRMSEVEGSTWREAEGPDEVFKRAFWFTSIEDPSGIDNRHLIGVDRIMLEVDYPHADSSWPDTQEIVAGEIAHLPDEDRERIAYKNACGVYGLSIESVEQVSSQLAVGSLT